MSQSLQQPQGNERVSRYWLSLNEYETPAASNSATAGEFLKPPQLALDEEASKLGLSRRSFMKVMGASAAMASFAGCTRRPVQTIVPYVTKPEEITHGIPNVYASNDPVSGRGLLLVSREGRPVKVDGNEDHPLNGQGLFAAGQASIFDLYDPDRIRNPFIAGQEATWEAFDQATTALFNNREDVAFLTGTIHSPTTLAAIKRVAGRHYQFDGLAFDDIRKGQRESFGANVLPTYRIDRAKMVVSIDADFLDTMITPEAFTKQFAQARQLQGQGYSQFVAFESSMRLTGQNADLRVPIHPGDRLVIALGLAYEVSRRLGRPLTDLDGFGAKAVAERAGIDAAILSSVADDLAKNRGRSLVLAGGMVGKSGHAVALQNAVNYLNSILGNDGVTVLAGESSNLCQGAFSDVQALMAAMNSGSVKTLVIQGVNPLYLLPKASGFAEALKKVPNVIYFSRYRDESFAAAKFVAAESHAFEIWGDVNPVSGVYGVVQPTIRPLFDTRGLLDQISVWTAKSGEVLTPYEQVRNTFKGLQTRARTGADFETFWEEVLQKGFLDLRASEARSSTARNFSTGALVRAVREARTERPQAGDDTFSLVLQATVAMGDGSQANNAHLHELPDPVTKATWGNFLLISPKAAERLALKDGEIVRIENANFNAELAVLRQPGLRDNVVVSSLGYGRKLGGRVADEVGVSLLEFVQVENGALSFLASNIKLSKTGRFDEVAVTQEHHSLEGRDILFETTYEQFRNNPASGIVKHVENPESLWSGFQYNGYRWGMVIDLNRCTGCSACMVACAVENNIPVVGKEGVRRGREMFWIRLDRYYSGDPANPETLHQPMTCQQCENAPCETVCPVLATVHNNEGLNSMIYNRCVGTRYCANNCPYKVRRFNFLEYNTPMNGKFEHPIALSKNPEVTLRSRGVMEKCTFCVQRIEYSKNVAKREGRKVRDGEVRTACQVACPAEAISFGDINDEGTQVSRMSKEQRGYKVLEELNTKPSITYLTRVWNRAPKAEADGHHGASGHEGGH